MSEVEHPRATTASVDRRVERLEENFLSLDRKVEALGARVESAQKMTEMQLNSIQTTLTANSIRYDSFIVKIEQMIVDALKDSGDVRSSAAGRGLDDRLMKIESMIGTHSGYIDQQRGAGAAMVRYVAPLVSVLVAIVALVLAWPK